MAKTASTTRKPRRTRKRREQRTYPPDWMTRLYADSWGQASSGVPVNAETALKYAAFYSAVDILARGIATAPLKWYRRLPDDSREKAPEHPVYSLLHTRPNPETSSWVWRHCMMVDVGIRGNALSEIARRGDGRPGALWHIPWRRVQVDRRDRNGDLIYIIDKGTGDEAVLSYEDVIHVRTLGEGQVGKTPVTLFQESIGLGLATEKAGAKFFGQGMRPTGSLEHPGKLTDKALKHLREQFESENTGIENWARPLITEEGMKWNQWTIPPNDAQFLETRVHQVDVIASIFHIPPHMLAELSKATFSNIEEQAIEFVTVCLAPWFENWEQELSYKLTLGGEEEKFYAKFGVNQLMRGNAAARAAFYQTMFGIGSLSQNDIRRLEDENPIPGGDTYYVPMNLMPADIVAEYWEQKLNPPKPALPATMPDSDMPMGEPPANPPGKDVQNKAAGLLLDAWRYIVRTEQRTLGGPKAENVLNATHADRLCSRLLPLAELCGTLSGNGENAANAVRAAVARHIEGMRAANAAGAAAIEERAAAAPLLATEHILEGLKEHAHA